MSDFELAKIAIEVADREYRAHMDSYPMPPTMNDEEFEAWIKQARELYDALWGAQAHFYSVEKA